MFLFSQLSDLLAYYFQHDRSRNLAIKKETTHNTTQRKKVKCHYLVYMLLYNKCNRQTLANSSLMWFNSLTNWQKYEVLKQKQKKPVAFYCCLCVLLLLWTGTWFKASLNLCGRMTSLGSFFGASVPPSFAELMASSCTTSAPTVFWFPPKPVLRCQKCSQQRARPKLQPGTQCNVHRLGGRRARDIWVIAVASANWVGEENCSLLKPLHTHTAL